MSIFNKKKDGPPILACVGDTHTNSYAGLLPPKVHREDGSTHTANVFQQWMWDKWLRYWGFMGELKEKQKSQLIVVLNGDSVDKNKFSQDELISLNPVTILEWAVQANQPAIDVADILYVVRGTPAHTGESSWLEEEIARKIGAKKETEQSHSWWNIDLEVNGVRFNIKHTPESNSTRPWTKGSGALRIAKIVMDNYYESGDPPPHIVLRNHQHHWEDSGTNFFTRAFMLPAWQGDTSFVHKIGIGGNLPLFGGVYFTCYGIDNHLYDWDKITYRAKRKESEKINV